VQANDNPRILVLDIETKLVETFSFGIRDQYLAHTQIKDLDASGRILHMIGMKWVGERKTTVLTEWDDGYEGMMWGVHAALSEATAVLSYNGISFDMPKIEGQFGLLNIPLPPKPTQIDLYKAVRKMGFICNKLDYIAPLFGLGSKVKHDGMKLWKDVFAGCPKARAKMAKYCAGDVRLTEDLYHRLKPYIRNHPRLKSGGACPCGSSNVQYRGFNHSQHFRTQRIFCLDCKSWSTGKRERAA
jgi:hypothetical protein